MSDRGGIDFEALLEAFRAEAEERLAAMEEALLALGERPGDEELLHTVFRGLHTLKGDASTVGLTRLADLAHVAEDLLQRVREGAAEIEPAGAALLLRTVDIMRQLAGGEDVAPAAYEQVLAALRSFRFTGVATAPESVAPGGEGEGGSGKERLRSLRVGVEKLDRLLDLMGEIGVARGRLRLLLAGLPRPVAAETLRAFDEADPLHLELQELVMNARLVPIGPAFRQQQRALREAAAALGKPARLVVEDNHVEVDAKVIEQMRAPLAHLVRNAVDHGIEPAATRTRLGKPAAGTVTLRARHEGTSVVVEVADDGGGLDEERILARAVAHGLIAEGQPASEREVQRWLFVPGFSTAETVTGISGRGVGLDVVHRSVEALRGSVEVESRRGSGVTFRMRLPLTLAILEGFGVGVGEEAYILPMDAVQECADLVLEERGDGGARGILNLRGQPMPYLRLRRRFALEDRPPARESVVVVRDGERRVGLVVDRLLGGGQVVVKPLAAALRGLPGFFGTTILGNGRVALILDVPGVLRSVLAEPAPISTFQEQNP